MRCKQLLFRKLIYDHTLSSSDVTRAKSWWRAAGVPVWRSSKGGLL